MSEVRLFGWGSPQVIIPAGIMGVKRSGLKLTFKYGMIASCTICNLILSDMSFFEFILASICFHMTAIFAICKIAGIKTHYIGEDDNDSRFWQITKNVLLLFVIILGVISFLNTEIDSAIGVITVVIVMLLSVVLKTNPLSFVEMLVIRHLYEK